jgi:hypothetical protein
MSQLARQLGIDHGLRRDSAGQARQPAPRAPGAGGSGPRRRNRNRRTTRAGA